jgi:hypothetical protein
MADVPSPVDREYSSRSEGNRRLLAVTFAALLIASVSHIASYFGFVVIQSRILQNLLTWLLAPLAIWQILISSVENQIPRPWWTLMALAWIYATILGQFLPVGHIYPWPRTMRWFGLGDLDPLVVQARTSSASQVAAALCLFLILWYRPGGTDAASLEKIDFTRSPLVRRLAAFGIALPMGILVAGGVFRNQNWDADLIGWMGIIAGFWLIAGMIVTGIYLSRDALRRDT